MSRIAVFDPFSGASGDMILGALVDAGVPLASIQDAVSRLGIEGVRITSQPASSGAIRGTRVLVEPAGEQPSRDWRTIRLLLEESALAPPVRDAALAVFAALAAAEAEAHGEPIEQVHFHEVGAVDAIVDIVGACAGLDALGVEQIASHPVAVGSGWVRSDHGLLPVPAPATAILLAQAGGSHPAGPSRRSSGGRAPHADRRRHPRRAGDLERAAVRPRSPRLWLRHARASLAERAAALGRRDVALGRRGG